MERKENYTKTMQFKFLLFCLFASIFSFGQTANTFEENRDNLPEHIYNLTISEQTVNFTGKTVQAMTINGGIPGPVLEFTEGEYAIINVTNTMSKETSVHWHGIILPNFYDGVPYLTTPPIKPGETLQYRFALKQSGTYWYHSHTMLQEQLGVYGAIVVKPKQQMHEYDKELTLVLSDWMDESPRSQLKNLKRGNEWYLIKKKQVQSWNKIIKKKAVGAKLKMLWQRMPDMAISDNYYDTFLINGKNKVNYEDFKPGDKVRLRFVNAGAASNFWITFGGKATLIAADGKDITPVTHNRTLIAIAETYDFLVTIPENGKLEIKATAQDGSGQANAYLGTGEIIAAPEIPVPDLIEQMKEMMAMKMKMGAPASKFRPRVEDSVAIMKKYAMKMESMDMQGIKMDGEMNHDKRMDMDKKEMKDGEMDHNNMNMHEGHDNMSMEGHNMEGYKIPKEYVVGDNMKTAGNPSFNYNYLKSPEKIVYNSSYPVKELLFNLTGNMNRYVWSINGVPLNETDKIKIEQGTIVRITLNNLTMMHHPMHLHGHFFRVLNANGEYSPLKHTVNVAPMQKVVIEFEATEYGDWFFHCHVLYHMNSGMARIFSYDTPRDPRLAGYPLRKLQNEAGHYFVWSEVTAASHMAEFYTTATNIRNQFILQGEYGWNKNMEAEFSYQRYLNDYLRVFAGINAENEMEDSLEEVGITAIGGIRYLLPLLINSELRIDNKLRPQISFSKSTLIFPHIAIFGEYEYQIDFGWADPIGDANYTKETTWQAGAEYIFARNFSVMASYDNRFGAGGGLSVRF